MLIAAVADVHAYNHRQFGGAMEGGVNARCRVVVEALKVAVRMAQKENADAFWVLGDLVDTAKPSPQVLHAVGQALQRAPGLVVVKGNHDNVSDTYGDHALASLRWLEADVVEVAQARDDAFAFIPFQAGMSSEWLPEAWKRAVGPATRAVGMHLGIADDATAAFLQRAPDATTLDALAHLVKGTQVDFVLAGNWHQHNAWEVKPHAGHAANVIQCGTFAPAGFDDALPFEQKAYGSLIFVDTERKTWWRTEIPGPRFEKVRWAEDGEERVRLVAAHARKCGHSMFVQVRAEPREMAKARALLATFPELAGYQVLPETAALQAQAQHAAAATRGADSLRAGVRKFVREMACDEGVKRDDVQSRALAYLKG